MVVAPDFVSLGRGNKRFSGNDFREF